MYLSLQSKKYIAKTDTGTFDLSTLSVVFLVFVCCLQEEEMKSQAETHKMSRSQTRHQSRHKLSPNLLVKWFTVVQYSHTFAASPVNTPSCTQWQTLFASLPSSWCERCVLVFVVEGGTFQLNKAVYCLIHSSRIHVVWTTAVCH